MKDWQGSQHEFVELTGMIPSQVLQPVSDCHEFPPNEEIKQAFAFKATDEQATKFANTMREEE